MLGVFLLMALVAGLTTRSCVGERQKQRASELRKLAERLRLIPAQEPTVTSLSLKLTLFIYLPIT